VLLTVLGCQAGVPRHGRSSSGYLVSDTGTTVLLDCGPGPGVAASLSGLGVRLDAVVVSHLHLDHCHDLLVLAKQLVTERAPAPLLLAPAGARDVFDAWRALFPGADVPAAGRPFAHAFEIREHGPVQVGPLALTVHPMAHAVPACGIRVAGPGGTLAYTGVGDRLVPLARDADLFLAEATLDAPDTSDHGHLCAADAARAATAAGVRALALTHRPDGADSTVAARRAAAAEHFAGPVQRRRPG